MLTAKLQMRQTQSLVMTPQLLQSIRLLQFSHTELQSFIDAEVERNPLLEPGEPIAVADGFDDDGFGRGAMSSADGPAVGGSVTMLARDEASAPTLSGARTDEDAYRDGFGTADASAPERGEERSPILTGSSSAGGGSHGEGFDGMTLIEAIAEKRPSLSAHALAEVQDAVQDPVEGAIAEMLVGHLDEAGYLRIDPDVMAEELGLASEALMSLVRRIQDCVEPAGLFALDLADCLSIQLKRKGRLDPVITAVLDHLDLLARRDFSALRRITGEDEAGLLDILAEIRRLDPKPGHGFDASHADVIVPDILVEEASDGTWRIELNPDALPRVLVQTEYVKRIATGQLSAEEKTFISDCHASANWLVRSLDQRARTILKVAGEIVRRQDGFLTQGIAGLKPLTLMAVAEAVGMHESTISRVTANKYMATPRGTFELKFFFSVAIASSSGGDAHSAESVKHRIRLMVDAEYAGAILSDDDIADRLKKDGVDLARRTVAKYREALGIPSSIQRRREFNARKLAS